MLLDERLKSVEQSVRETIRRLTTLEATVRERSTTSGSRSSPEQPTVNDSRKETGAKIEYQLHPVHNEYLRT
jgi:hypothetical protein